MHITVTCPTCRSHYQVEPRLRGQPMRCPNPVCREIFVVEEDDGAAAGSSRANPTASGPSVPPFKLEPFGNEPTEVESSPGAEEKSKHVGSVGDLIPILDAEIVEETPAPARKARPKSPPTVKASAVEESVEERRPPETPPEPASWREPPPVRSPGARGSTALPVPVSSPPAPPEEKEKKDAARKADRAKGRSENGPGMVEWEAAPPLRRRNVAESAPPNFAATGTSEPEQLPVGPAADIPAVAVPSTGRRALWIIGGMVVAAAVLIGTVTVIALEVYWNKENNLYEQALADYKDQKFSSGAAKFDELMRDFPQSSNLPRYRFLEEFCQIRDRIHTVSDPREVHGRLRRFLDEYNGDVLLKEHKSDAANDYRLLAQKLVDLGDERLDHAILQEAREALEDCLKYFEIRPDNAAMEKQLAVAEAKIQNARTRKEFVDQLKEWIPVATLEIAKEARNRAKGLGLDQDQEIKDLIRDLDAKVGSKVAYVVEHHPPGSGGATSGETSLLFAPLLAAPGKEPTDNSRVVLALSRGVLYALDLREGTIRWVIRVGIDTTSLPVRLPRTASSEQELFLVLSADHNTIMALTAKDGQVLWQYQLSAPSLGRPLIVDGKAYVPTYDGRVYEIETFLGNVLGYFSLGQPLTVGGVRQEGTNLLYFPGDSDNIYVLEVPTKESPSANRACKKILFTGHPAGSLRSEPIIINRTEPFARGANNIEPSYLILSQSDGLDHMKLRVFGLPIEAPDAEPILRPEPRVQGWSWFQPYYDSEKLAFVTDKGYLGLFGINQPKNEDPPLFPIIREEKHLADNPPGLARGQVLHALENQFWVLANGQLQRLYLDVWNQKMVPDWTAWLKKGENAFLGSPLHAGQFDENSRTLFVVTHDWRRQVQLATTVDAETGKILWQRQLGMECQEDPVVLGREVVLTDRGGELLVLQPGAAMTPLVDRHWLLADALVKEPLEGKAIASYLFPVSDGSVYQIACPSEGQILTVRHWTPAGKKFDAEYKVRIDGVWLGGTPALTGNPEPDSISVLLPLADGSIQRVRVGPNGPVIGGGPTWRSKHADDEARGHVVRINAQEFLVTDGSTGLTHWFWKANDPGFQKTPETTPEDAPHIQLHARIIAPPIVLPAPNAKAPFRVCVADADGNIALLEGAELKAVRSWPLNGQLTAGPFLRGQHIGCVVGHDRLVWINPKTVTPGVDKDHQEPAWTYSLQGGAGIVGEPQLVNGMLVLVDLSGRVVALNPETGQSLGKNYTIKATSAPAATAVAFGEKHALVWLTDGTAIILPFHVLGDVTNPVSDLFP